MQLSYITLDGQRIAYYFPLAEAQQQNMFGGPADEHTPGAGNPLACPG